MWRDLAHCDAMRSHALRRLFERFGIAMTNSEYDALVTAIRDGRNPPIGPARGGGSLHAVALRNRTIYAVWNTDEQRIATFLPAGMPIELRA